MKSQLKFKEIINRRNFLNKIFESSAFLVFASELSLAVNNKIPTKNVDIEKDICKEDISALALNSFEFVSAEATYFSRYQHFHWLNIPLNELAFPKSEGFKTRTTELDQESLDEIAFNQFINESGLDGASLKKHSHEVYFTQKELERIASGEENVEITVLTPKKNLAHRFYYTASKSAIIKIEKRRQKG